MGRSEINFPKKKCFNYFRIVTDLTFTRSSSADFILQKLRRIFLIYNDLLDCLNIVSNTCAFQVFEVLVTSSILIAICLFAKFRCDPFSIWSRLFGIDKFIPFYNHFRVFTDYTRSAYNISQVFLLVGLDSMLFGVIPSVWCSTETILTVSKSIDLFCFVRLKFHQLSFWILVENNGKHRRSDSS